MTSSIPLQHSRKDFQQVETIKAPYKFKQTTKRITALSIHQEYQHFNSYIMQPFQKKKKKKAISCRINLEE